MTNRKAERAALLAAIREEPDDDTHRLVYADWLEDNGAPERAEFIRLQIERAQAGQEEPSARERELLTARVGEWTAGLPEWVVALPDDFERGWWPRCATCRRCSSPCRARNCSPGRRCGG